MKQEGWAELRGMLSLGHPGSQKLSVVVHLSCRIQPPYFLAQLEDLHRLLAILALLFRQESGLSSTGGHWASLAHRALLCLGCKWGHHSPTDSRSGRLGVGSATCTSHREVLRTTEVAFVESLESSSPTMQRTAVVPRPWLAKRTVALPGPLTCCTNLSQPQLSTLLAERLGSPLAYRRTAKLTLLTASEALVKEEL